MNERLAFDWAAWWNSVPVEFAFLLTLAFLVGALGLLADPDRDRPSA